MHLQICQEKKVIRRYTEALALHTGATTLNWEDNTSCISVVEAQGVTTIVKHIDIPVCFIQDKFENGIFITKY